MKKRILLTLMCLVLGLLQACKKDASQDFPLSDPKDFSEYISAFTTGMISSKSPIDIALTKNWGNWKDQEEIDSKLFTISPAVKGKLHYLPNQTLRFEPAEQLKQDQKYYISFHLGKITAIEGEEQQTFSFLVHTVPQQFTTEFSDLQSADKDTYILNGVLKSSDWVSTETIQKITSVQQGKQALELSFQTNATQEAKEFPFTIRGIKRQKEASEVSLTMDAKSIQLDQKTTQDFAIPAKDVFQVHQILTTIGDNHAFAINFSNPIKKNQTLDGLIRLQGLESLPLTFLTEGNLVKVYSEKALPEEVTLLVEEGIIDSYGNKLNRTHTENITFAIPKPEVQVLQNGTILPSSENLKINFKATSLKAVDIKVYKIYQNNILQFLQSNNLDGSYSLYTVAAPIAKTTIELTNPDPKALMRWNAYAIDLSTLIKPDPGAIYHIKFSFKKSYAINCASDSEEDIDTEADEEVSPEDDEYEYYYRYYPWEEREDPCSEAYYYYTQMPTINVLASDLGLIVKGGNDNVYTAIVTNILTTAPVNGATVEFYSYQQQLLASAKTDKDGIAKVNLGKNKAYFAIAKQDTNTTYLKIDQANALSVSNYDVDGTTLQKGMNGYVYTERGVWRPGDNIHIGFILDDIANPLPENHPIKLTLSDPFGKVTEQLVQKKNAANHYAFKLKTAEEAPTGNWEAVIQVGGAKFYKRIKVETIKPNRLKIKNNAEGKVITSDYYNKQIDYTIEWLQGSTAKNLKADVQIKLIPEQTTFKTYPQYRFNNSLSTYATEDINVYSGRTNENGAFSFALNLKNTVENSAMLKAILTTKVYENGGDVSTDVSTLTYSPFASYVGIKAPEANKYGYYETDKPLAFSVVTVDSNGKTLGQNVKVDVYRKKGYWWWSSNESGVSNYNASDYYSLYRTDNLTTSPNGATKYELNIPEQDWGSYEVVITNLNSGHIASQQVYVDWPYWSAKTKHKEGKDAIALSIATDKKEYTVDEKIKLSFPSSEGGRALVSVESGSSVLATHWVQTKQGETTFELPATAAMAPNAYLSITLIQPHAYTLNNAPIRLYGIAPISVYNKKTKLEPEILMPDKLRPEEKFTLKVKEKNGHKMTYTIAIVEDGLLDLTHFKTPTPWQNFYSKSALGVRTWDVFDFIIGAYGGTINQVFSIGGDEDLGAGQVKKANRFKPVVIFLGPYTVEKGKMASHEIKLPKYIGSVRTMIVASNTEQRAYGHTDKTVKVNNPLMILGSLPRRAVPGEKITLPVTVFAMEKHVKNVQISVKTDDKFKLTGASTQQLSFSEPDEKVAYFELEVANKTGISKIEIEATSGKEKASYSIELDVLNPNPITTRTQVVSLDAQSEETLDWNPFGIAGSNKATLELSTFPNINLTTRLNYLITFPHGCTEQITSGVFPQLYLNDLVTLDDSKKQSIQRNVNEGIQRLAQRQFSDGGFAYWPGNSYADDWATSYVGHFFVEAEKKGYALPVNSKANWISYQQKIARQWKYNPRYATDFAQAYRLYTLALAGQPDVASMNRLRETQGISTNTKFRLAAAYALAGQKEAAQKLIANLSLDEIAGYSYYGSYERNLAMVLETLMNSGGNKIKTHEYAIELANKLGSSQWMSTQTTAYALNAISKYVNVNKPSDGIHTQYTYNGQAATVNTTKAMVSAELKNIKSSNALAIQNKSDAILYARLTSSGILPVGQEQADQSNLLIKTTYRSTTGVVLNPASIEQGTEFICDLTISNTSNRSIENVALTHIVPSGWEIVNLRYTDAGGAQNQVDYTDIRDDRSLFYFTLNANSTKTLKVTLNASYLGNYYLPGVQANAMYDNSYRCRTIGQWVEVVK
ncbi:alpha-2-macroglobulin family protein [Myroides odoratus]|uniref:alpha-2-macroglobulin family protein n=1 Tax=Myroides odoratus TaxID=256 RepID=UPI0039AFBC51